MTHVGNCIRNAQVRSGISSKDMCDHCGVVRQQLHRWHKAEDMRLSKVYMFAEYFDMTLPEFLSMDK